MRDVNRPSVQMQPVLEFAEAPRDRPAVFDIAYDWRADMREVSPELMGSTRDRAKRDPGVMVSCGGHHRIVRRRRFGVFVMNVRRVHPFIAALAPLLGERELDDATLRLWHALGQRPIDLPCVAAAQGLRQRGSRWKRTRDDQYARRVAVEAMHEAWTLALVALKALEHAVDVTRDA